MQLRSQINENVDGVQLGNHLFFDIKSLTIKSKGANYDIFGDRIIDTAQYWRIDYTTPINH